MEIKELRGISNEELVLKERALKKELFDLNFQRKFSRVEKPGRFKQVRRDIARIHTLIRERELHGTTKGIEDGATNK